MALTSGDRRTMVFVAVVYVVTCMLAIAALVLAAIMVSMVRSSNVSAPKTDQQSALVQGKQNKKAEELVVKFARNIMEICCLQFIIFKRF